MDENFELPKLNKKIEEKQEENEKKEDKIILEEKKTLKETFKRVYKFLTDASLNEIGKFFIELLILVLIVILFKLPFDLIIELGSSIFTTLGINVTAFWNILFNILYTIVGIWYYLRVFKNRFWNIKEKYQRK